MGVPLYRWLVYFMENPGAKLDDFGVALCFFKAQIMMISLAGWFGTLLFFHILGIVTPTDFHIFQRARYTTNQLDIYGN